MRAILVPYDGSEQASKALTFACDLAEKYDAEVQIIHVVPRLSEGLKRWSEVEHVRLDEQAILRSEVDETLRQAKARAASLGVKNVIAISLFGDPAATVVEHAKAYDVDMIVMGDRGTGDLQALVSGSTAHAVARLAPCTCVTVK